jgi:glyoxylase-like metal-dependent hydrolase (beta-lactamase superfamily II)
MPRIAEGLHRLGSDLINFYLVEDATGLTVVDAGIPAFYDKLAVCLRETGHDWGDIRALVLTHAHPDHVGFAERLRSEHGVPVLVHAADEQLALTQDGGKRDGSIVPYLRYPAAWKLMGVLSRAGRPSKMRIAEVRTFAADDRLDVPGRPLVLHAPGHTDGCVALHFEGHAALLVGDVLCSRNPLTGREGVQLMPAAFATSSAQALASLDRLESVQAAVIGFGHGDPWRGGVSAAVASARSIGRT